MPYFELFLSFLQIGLFSIGGGYAAIPLIQSQVVEKHAWLSMAEFTDLVTIAEMTPGPIAVNSATFVGIRIAGFGGAVVATLACILPSLVIVSLLAYVYYRYKQLSGLQCVLARPAPGGRRADRLGGAVHATAGLPSATRPSRWRTSTGSAWGCSWRRSPCCGGKSAIRFRSMASCAPSGCCWASCCPGCEARDSPPDGGQIFPKPLRETPKSATIFGKLPRRRRRPAREEYSERIDRICPERTPTRKAIRRANTPPVIRPGKRRS